MDPSIMKLLEDDEDESMHSGADVEALSAALNRDIGGDASTFSQPSDSESGVLPEGNSASKQLVGQWQSSNQNENSNQQIQQREEQLHLQSAEQHSFEIKPMHPGSSAKSQDQQISGQAEHGQMQLQQDHSHSNQQLQTQENQPQTVEKDQVMKSEQTPFQFSKQDSTQNSERQQQHTYQQRIQQQATPVNEADNSTKRTKSSPSIPFQLLIPIIRPHLDKDRSMQLQAVFTKLKTNEVSKEDFLRVIRNIVGDQMLRQAVNKVHMQLQTEATRNQQTNPNQYSLQNQVSSQQLLSRGTQQLTEPQSFPPLHPMSSAQHQKGPSRQPHVPASTVQMQMDTGFPTFENSSQKSREIENKSDGKGMHAAQAVNKQLQHSQQTSFSMYGGSSSTFHSHPYPRPPVSAAATHLKSQMQDSQMRQAPHTQGMVSTQLGSSQPNNAMNVAKYELHNIANETKRLHGGSLSGHLTSQQNPATWQPLMNRDHRGTSLPPMVHVKQEANDQAAEPPHRSQLTAAEGSSFGSGHIDQGNSSLGSFKDEAAENQSSRMGFSTPLNTTASNISGPVANQLDSIVQISSTSPPIVAGTTTRTPPKKSSIGQKKPFEAVATASPSSSKKQKTSVAFLDQSIEHLNDVTAVSGVNLREEEEQLFSAPKEDSRASEATRRVVQEEEERLILQKGPLQKKLAEIMSKCGLKSISRDVERCLSMCVEERLRGLISSMIRLSKQRVDLEKVRHRYVITSDVGRQILTMNRKAKEEWDKKQAEEAEKLRKLNETEGNIGTDADKQKDEGRSKNIKVNKEEDDKMRTTAANVAARAAVGGDDMLSKWQLLAEQARQKRDGLDVASSTPGKSTSHKPSPSFRKSLKGQQELEKRGPSSISGGNRKFGRSLVSIPHPRVARNISTKDVIAVLEREPQMSKSTLIYRLYDKLAGDFAAEQSV